MIILLFLLPSVVHAGSQDWWRNKGHYSHLRQEPFDGFSHDRFEQSSVFKSAVMDDSQPLPEEDKYSVETVKREVMTIEFNMWCYIVNICYYDDFRYETLLSKWFYIDKPLDLLIATKDLLETTYGTRFSTPMEGQQEHFDKGKALYDRFKWALGNTTKQWEKINSFNTGYTDGGILSNFVLRKSSEAIFMIQDKKTMEDTVARMELVRDRFNTHSEAPDVNLRTLSDMPSESDELRNPTVYQTPVNVTYEVEEVRNFVHRLFGYIFNIKPSLNFEIVTLGNMKPKPEKADEIVFFRRALEDLYGDLADEKKAHREGSFSRRHHEEIYNRLFKTANEIHQFLWDQVFMLSHRQRVLTYAFKEYNNMVWARAMYASAEEIDEIEKRLEEVKALTFANTTTVTIEADFV